VKGGKEMGAARRKILLHEKRLRERKDLRHNLKIGHLT
jgi:hypothetical protein